MKLSAYERHATYLADVLGSRARQDRFFSALAKELQSLRVPRFDTIVVCGLSGMLVGPRIARRLKKRLAIVRKGDGSHSHCLVEGEIHHRWLFLDDEIDTGRTARYCIRAVAAASCAVAAASCAEGVPSWYKPKFVGAFAYSWMNEDDSRMLLAPSARVFRLRAADALDKPLPKLVYFDPATLLVRVT